ncbi:MAG: LapA family protein [Actinomycetota bacterium]|nr:LapA family protein [Actinomycetota bacterium]
MPIGLVLLLAFIGWLVIGWLVMAYKAPPLKRRDNTGYAHQHTENPDWLPPSGGGQGGI